MWRAVGGNNKVLLRELTRAKQLPRKAPGRKRKHDLGRLQVAAVVCAAAVIKGRVHPKAALREWLGDVHEKLKAHRHLAVFETFGKGIDPVEAATDTLWDRLQDPDLFTEQQLSQIIFAAAERARLKPK
jgi:hypothetical protein